MKWSIGDELDDGRLNAPSAERNKDPILAVLQRVLPARGVVLEVASGSGQHAVHFAAGLPALAWQPSDPDPAMLHSIARWRDDAALPNLRPPILLDVMRSPWPVESADAIVCINMLHVAPWPATAALFDGARALLRDGAPVVLYGPYRREGAPTAASNERFDAQLRAHDPRWGLRDAGEVAAVAARAGFAHDETVEMPANNLVLVLRRRAA